MMQSINGIVVHYFSGKYQFPDDPLDTAKCYNLFKDLNRPAAKREHYKMNDVQKRMYASAHFMIARDGTVLDLVPLPHKAWHAGKSEWNGKKYCNNWMIGIEMVATDNSGYTDEQYDALAGLTMELIDQYDINWDNITGHENIAPGRKKDPGELFDWERYRALEQTEEPTTISDIIDGVGNDWFGPKD
jgi:N-acetyl-anhydromuramyl-L-alanine amidase AmpD